jgi:hypothetical protein
VRPLLPPDPWQHLTEHFGLRVTDLPELFAPRFNVAPTQQVLTVRFAGCLERERKGRPHMTDRPILTVRGPFDGKRLGGLPATFLRRWKTEDKGGISHLFRYSVLERQNGVDFAEAPNAADQSISIHMLRTARRYGLWSASFRPLGNT